MNREQIRDLTEAALAFAEKVGATWVTGEWVAAVLSGSVPEVDGPEQEKRRVLTFIRDALAELEAEEPEAELDAAVEGESEPVMPDDPRSDVERAISGIVEVLQAEPDAVVLFAYKVVEGRAKATRVFFVPPDLRPFHKAAILDHQVDLVVGKLGG